MVDVALRQQNIGVFPLRKILTIAGVLFFVWAAWHYVITHRKELPQVIIRATDPYQAYMYALVSPDPSEQVQWIGSSIQTLYSIPGWAVDSLKYENGVLNALVMSRGMRSDVLFEWAEQNQAEIQAAPDGFHIIIKHKFPNRGAPRTIYNLDKVIAVIADSVSYIQTGNNLDVGTESMRGKFAERSLKISFAKITPLSLEFIGETLKNLPLNLGSVTVKVDGTGFLSGTMNLKALGN